MQSATADTRRPRASKKKKLRPKHRARRWLIIGSAAVFGSTAALWVAVHRYEWLGPLVANGLRSVLGTSAVAKLEDWVYAAEDQVNQLVRHNEAPKAYWTVPSHSASALAAAPPPASSTPSTEPQVPPFHPRDPGPALKQWSAEGDGIWVPITDPRRPQEPPYLYKTLLHPDASRSWAEVFVVAIDIPRVDLYVIAGRQEPKTDDPKTESYQRRGIIPPEHHEELLAAFNGGFMTEHGGYGMKVDGVTLVHPKPNACTLAQYNDGSVRIAPWRRIAETEAQMRWYRQAPECMYEGGKIHPGLIGGGGLKWGATLDGDTVIRRSAVGLSADRQILYVSITNHTTARALATGLRHAGAVDVAQLDVNWSYPKFVLFEPVDGGAERKAVALASGFEFSEDEYIRKRARRDFFYVMRKKKTDAPVPSAP